MPKIVNIISWAAAFVGVLMFLWTGSVWQAVPIALAIGVAKSTAAAMDKPEPVKKGSSKP